MPNGPKIAAITLVVILAAAGLYYAFIAPSTPSPSRAGAGASEPAAAAPAARNGLGSQSPTTIPSVGAAPSPATSTPAIGALTGNPTPTTGLGGNGLAQRPEQPGFVPGSLGAADSGKGDLPPTARPSVGGTQGGSMNGLPAGGLSARPIGPTQPTSPAAGQSPAAPATPTSPDLNGPRPVAPERPGTPAPTAGGTSGEQVHVVASGDTMSGIAKRYLGKESAWNAIAKANPNVDPTAMKVGTRLRIPAADSTGSGGGAASGTTPAATNTTEGASGGNLHTVVAGDTLSSISRKHYGDGKHWEKIYEANKNAIGSDPARLKVGQRLTLPKLEGASAR